MWNKKVTGDDVPGDVLKLFGRCFENNDKID
jgi:hypothetical protein